MSTAVAPARLARVHVIDAKGRLGLEYVDGGVTVVPVPRPFVGGPKTGFHAAPQPNDMVLVHSEIYGKPNSVSSTIVDGSVSLYPLAPGEMVILHADGRVACKLSNDGSTIVLQTPAGATISVDNQANITLATVAPAGTINLNAPGGVFVQGKRVLTYEPV